MEGGDPVDDRAVGHVDRKVDDAEPVDKLFRVGCGGDRQAEGLLCCL